VILQIVSRINSPKAALRSNTGLFWVLVDACCLPEENSFGKLRRIGSHTNIDEVEFIGLRLPGVSE
jgi:hypothetical protein